MICHLLVFVRLFRFEIVLALFVSFSHTTRHDDSLSRPFSDGLSLLLFFLSLMFHSACIPLLPSPKIRSDGGKEETRWTGHMLNGDSGGICANDEHVARTTICFESEDQEIGWRESTLQKCWLTRTGGDCDCSGASSSDSDGQCETHDRMNARVLSTSRVLATLPPLPPSVQKGSRKTH